MFHVNSKSHVAFLLDENARTRWFRICAAPFVTNYDERNWELLVENFHSLPMNIKLQLLFDSMVLANMNRLDYSIFLRMSAEMVSNEEYLPLWLSYSNLVRNQMNWFHGLVGRKYRVSMCVYSNSCRGYSSCLTCGRTFFFSNRNSYSLKREPFSTIFQRINITVILSRREIK